MMTEEEILLKVYNKKSIENHFVKSETPDFIITDPSNNKKFGVEITTLYYSQASAISRDNNFLDRFIDNNKSNFKKKKKKPKFLEKLNIGKVLGEDNFVNKSRVIWQMNNADDFFDFFEKLIKKKNASYEKLGNLEFVNLIAKDEENFVKSNKLNPGEIYGYLREHSLFETIIKSNFQEIFFISELHSGVYNIPLKWYIFRNEYQLFGKFWFEKINLPTNKKEDIDLMLKNFCVCLIHLGFNGVYFFFDKIGNKYIAFGNTYWQINLEHKTIDEKRFTSMSLEKKTEMRSILLKHENYTDIFNQYLNFRKTICPILEDDDFIHLS